MTALVRDRMTPERKTEVLDLVAAPGATIFRGGITAINATGQALRPQDAGAVTVVGCAQTSTNEALPQATMPAGALPQGIVNAPNAVLIHVRRRAQFAYLNSPAGADALGAGDWGAPVYAVDDQTVAKTSNSGARLQAGICRGVDSAGVWVEFA